MSRGPRAGVRRDWGTDDRGATILHVDMDAFFAAVEVLDDPDLAGRAVIVGGRERGVVASASYEARAKGVHAAMPTAQALRLCPGAVLIGGRHARYREVSRQVMSVLESITPRVEPLGIDEAFLDVAGAIRRLGRPWEIGTLIRSRIHDEVGVPASVGIAGTKHVAKLASGFAKPDGMMLVPVEQTVPFLHSLPVGALWGVGDRTREHLESKGVRTVAQLAEVPRHTLARWIGPALAERLLELVWGLDEREVTPGRVEKSISTETTFPVDVKDRAELERTVLRQSHECAARLRAAALECTRVAIKVRHSDFSTITRSRSLPAPTFLGADIAAAARSLLGQVTLSRGGVRLIGVRTDGLVAAEAAGWQTTLDGTASDKLAAEKAMDEVRRRFGNGVISPAALLEEPEP
ncbi:MAG TPA: DNA polymerase IV [Actinomycetaceae bacterium]|nr:DNA polymerase IV [Actinomycetaceae bacterium]